MSSAGTTPSRGEIDTKEDLPQKVCACCMKRKKSKLSLYRSKKKSRLERKEKEEMRQKRKCDPTIPQKK